MLPAFISSIAEWQYWVSISAHSTEPAKIWITYIGVLHPTKPAKTLGLPTPVCFIPQFADGVVQTLKLFQSASSVINPLKFGCQSCGNIADEKVHLDCRNAEFLVTNT